MKIITQTPNLLKFLEANDPNNTLGVQLRIWEISNHTEIIVRIENQNKKASELLWKDGSTNGQVSDKVLSFLQELKIIKDQKHWTSSAHRTSEIAEMDEYEDSDKCIYYVFKVHDWKLVNF